MGVTLAMFIQILQTLTHFGQFPRGGQFFFQPSGYITFPFTHNKISFTKNSNLQPWLKVRVPTSTYLTLMSIPSQILLRIR